MSDTVIKRSRAMLRKREKKEHLKTQKIIKELTTHNYANVMISVVQRERENNKKKMINNHHNERPLH